MNQWKISMIGFFDFVQSYHNTKMMFIGEKHLAKVCMPWVTLVQMANLTIVFEDELLVKRKNMIKHWQDLDIDQYEKDSNEESYRKMKKKENKMHFLYI
jgi:hypothetical protein